MQRWQLTFERGEELLYVGHLDLMRAWERALHRAGVRLSYSQGFHPHPKMSFAAPLPVGVTGTAELMEVTLDEVMAADSLRAWICTQLPAGLRLTELVELDGRPLSARLRFAEYRVRLGTALSAEAVGQKIELLLSQPALPRVRQRDGQPRQYDLRPLIAAIWLEDTTPTIVVGMRLRANSNGAGRADEVVAALDLAETRCEIERSMLILEG